MKPISGLDTDSQYRIVQGERHGRVVGREGDLLSVWWDDDGGGNVRNWVDGMIVLNDHSVREETELETENHYRRAAGLRPGGINVQLTIITPRMVARIDAAEKRHSRGEVNKKKSKSADVSFAERLADGVDILKGFL